MDPSEWEQVGSIHDGDNNGVMVSNLPLLFANSEPSSLQIMTQRQLERFVSFMVKCSLGEEITQSWSKLACPPWWPKELPFKLSSGTAPTPSHRSKLQKLVERCYQYHRCEYLLEFCRQLVQQKPPGGYKFTDNRDGTTSMHHSETAKLLVTFRNENRDYDKASGPSSPAKSSSSTNSASSRPQLLPRRGSSASSLMVRPAIHDVYLCDRCDMEFTSLSEVQAHERECGGDANAITSPPSPPSPEPDLPDITQQVDPTDQVTRMLQLGLVPTSHSGLPPLSPLKRGSAPAHVRSPSPYGFSVRRVARSNYFKYDSVEFSSPLGVCMRKLLQSKESRGTLPSLSFSAMATQNSINRYERYCPAAEDVLYPNVRETCRGLTRWVIVFRDPKLPWYHYYSFTKYERCDRWLEIELGLTVRARKELSSCKPCSVKLQRLPKKVIDRLSARQPNHAPLCIDLTCDDRKQATTLTSSKNALVDQMLNFFRGKCQWALAPGFLEHVIAGGSVPNNPVAMIFYKLFSPTGVLVSLLGEAIKNSNWASTALAEYGTVHLSLEQHNQLLIKLGILNDVAVKFGASPPMTELVFKHGAVLANPQELVRLTTLPPGVQRFTQPKFSNYFNSGRNPSKPFPSQVSSANYPLSASYENSPSNAGPLRYRPGPKCRRKPNSVLSMVSQEESLHNIRRVQNGNGNVSFQTANAPPKNHSHQQVLQHNLDSSHIKTQLKKEFFKNLTEKKQRGVVSADPLEVSTGKDLGFESGVDENGIPVIDVIDLSSDDEAERKSPKKTNSLSVGPLTSSSGLLSKANHSVNIVHNRNNNINNLSSGSVVSNQSRTSAANSSFVRDVRKVATKDGSSSHYSTNNYSKNNLVEELGTAHNSIARHGDQSFPQSSREQINQSSLISKNERSHWSQLRSYGLGHQPVEIPVTNGYDGVLHCDQHSYGIQKTSLCPWKQNKNLLQSVGVKEFPDTYNYDYSPQQFLKSGFEHSVLCNNNNYLPISSSSACNTSMVDQNIICPPRIQKAKKRVMCGYDSEYEIEEVVQSTPPKKFRYGEGNISKCLDCSTLRYNEDLLVSCDRILDLCEKEDLLLKCQDQLELDVKESITQFDEHDESLVIDLSNRFIDLDEEISVRQKPSTADQFDSFPVEQTEQIQEKAFNSVDSCIAEENNSRSSFNSLLSSVNCYLNKSLESLKKMVLPSLFEEKSNCNEKSDKSYESNNNSSMSSIKINKSSPKTLTGKKALISCLQDECKELSGVKELVELSSSVKGRVTRSTVPDFLLPNKKSVPDFLLPNRKETSGLPSAINDGKTNSPIERSKKKHSSSFEQNSDKNNSDFSKQKDDLLSNDDRDDKQVDEASLSVSEVVASNLASGHVGEAFLSVIQLGIGKMLAGSSLASPHSMAFKNCPQSPSIMDTMQKRSPKLLHTKTLNSSPKRTWISDSSCLDSPDSDSNFKRDSHLSKRNSLNAGRRSSRKRPSEGLPFLRTDSSFSKQFSLPASPLSEKKVLKSRDSSSESDEFAQKTENIHKRKVGRLELRNLAMDEFKELKSSPLHPKAILKKSLNMKELLHFPKKRKKPSEQKPPLLTKSPAKEDFKLVWTESDNDNDTDVEDNIDSDEVEDNDNDDEAFSFISPKKKEAFNIPCRNQTSSRRPQVPYELKNLMSDECKEFHQYGFHPGDIVNTFNVGECARNSNYNSSSSSSENEVTFNFKKSRRKKPVVKNESIQKEKITNRELNSLFIDECKEFRRMKRGPSRPHPYDGSRRPHPYDGSRRPHPYDGSRRNILRRFPTKKLVSTHGFYRSRRTQKGEQLVVSETPRYLQREILKNEHAMCVLTYKVPLNLLS